MICPVALIGTWRKWNPGDREHLEKSNAKITTYVQAGFLHLQQEFLKFHLSCYFLRNRKPPRTPESSRVSFETRVAN